MKALVILLVSLGTGSTAAMAQLISGSGLLPAIASYLVVGLAFTLIGTLYLIFRAWDTERPSRKLVLRPASPAIPD